MKTFIIAAVVTVSLSEIQKVVPWVTAEYLDEHRKELDGMLYDLGLDSKNYPYEVFTDMHRNRFNEIVTCQRYVGNERTDVEWLNSGYASQEALDRSRNNKLLTDLYVKRGIFEE